MKEYYIRVFNQEELNEAIRLVKKLGYRCCWHSSLVFNDEKLKPHIQTYEDGEYGVYNGKQKAHGKTITISDLKEMVGEELNIGLNWLKERMDKYYFQLRGAVSAEETEEARIIAARLDELEYVYNKLKG